MISILIPIYNGIEYLEECLNSVFNQSYNQYEIIIGINGHPPNSNIYKLANTFVKKNINNFKIQIYDLQNVKGKSEALNEMVKFAKYNWIALLDVDDKWLFNKLEMQIPFINNYDVIGTKCKYFGNKNKIPSIPEKDISNFNFLEVNPIINSSCLVKKKLCYWNNRFDGVEDYDLWLRLWKQKRKFYNIPEILVLHRIHSNSAFNSKGNHEKGILLKEKYK